jgi:Zn-dependent peptidase ImmA (M78 family)/DNA-binding XRE family transcriptional regulator
MSRDMDVGARIREIRELIGMQAQELGLLVALDPSAISNIERGKRSVKSEELSAIAKALGVSPLAILERDSLLGRLPVSPRTANGTVLRGDVLERLTGLAELHEILAEWEDSRTEYGFPSVDTSQWLQEASALAEWATENLGASPYSDDRFIKLVGAIEEKLRVDVLVEERGTDLVAGASITDSHFSLIFINSIQPIPRALFTLAHELGHVLVQDGEFIVDQDLVARSNSERFANAFAAAFLLPESELRSHIKGSVPDAHEMSEVLDLYGTSFETLVYRLHNLRIINAIGRDKLRSLGLRGLISQIEDEALGTRLLARMGRQPTHHAPLLLSERAFIGYKKGVISSRPLAGLLGVPSDIVAATMELDAAAMLSDAVRIEVSDEDSEADLYSGSPVD